jgi:glucose-6-phosphate-specific signal transduction histidine kinase
MDRSAALRARLDTPLVALGLTVLYLLVWLLFLRVSNSLWYLPAGLRLGALWLVPTRRWPWLAAGEWTALGVVALGNQWPLVSPVFLGMSVMPWLIYAAIVRLLRGPEGEAGLDDPRQMLTLLGGGIAAAALVSPVLQLFMTSPGCGASNIFGFFAFMYGDILGQLVVAPLMVLAWQQERAHLRHLRLWSDVLMQLALSMAVIWLIGQRADLAPYLRLLVFAPIFLVAFRRGWEGAAISVALLGLLVEECWRVGLLPQDVRPLQLAMAVVGGGGLVLGAAATELRRSNERLALRHYELGEANRALTEAANELRLVSQRLVRLEEQGQRELAVELEYEIGRSIHALSTRISLAFRDIRDDQMLRLLESVREQVREMQESLRRVLRQLRPQALDTHGLREAIGFGPLRDMAEEAGIGYECAFLGNVEGLKDDAQTTVYRICQAAVREASRSQSVRRVLVRLDVSPGIDELFEVELQIDIEATSRGGMPFEPHPLPAITDRVVAQQGSYWTEPLSPGVRHKVQFAEVPVMLT